MKKLMDSAVLRLTAWYLLILFTLAVLFSFVVYVIGSHELRRPPKPNRQNVGIGIQYNGDNFFSENERLERAENSSKRLLSNLIVFDSLTLVLGGLCSFLLAKRTLSPIQEALESQARFSSDAAHELRTPLSVIQSEIEVVLRNKKSEISHYKETLKSNLDEVHRLQALTDRLLLLANQHDLLLEPVDLDLVATDAINNVLTLAQGKKISINSQVGDHKVLADHNSLTDVVTIILDNAIKYSPKNSTITLTSNQKGKYAYLSVNDDGIGINSQEQAKIFDRFYRSDESRSKVNAEGHGLGLSIAKRIIDAHNGTISVKSAVGKGSSFTIRLHKF